MSRKLHKYECLHNLNEMTYFSLVRSLLVYTCSVRESHNVKDIICTRRMVKMSSTSCVSNILLSVVQRPAVDTILSHHCVSMLKYKTIDYEPKEYLYPLKGIHQAS